MVDDDAGLALGMAGLLQRAIRERGIESVVGVAVKHGAVLNESVMSERVSQCLTVWK